MADVLPHSRHSASTTKLPQRSTDSMSYADATALEHNVSLQELPGIKSEPAVNLPSVVERRGLEHRPEGWLGHLPRLTWLFSSYLAAGIVAVAWLVYSVVRYVYAARVFEDDPVRYRYNLAFMVLSVFSLLGIAINLCMVAVGVKLMRMSHAVAQLALFMASVSVILPAAFNVAIVSLSRSGDLPDSSLSLDGRCTIDSDVIWSGRSGGCSNAVPWGTWLGVSVLRLLVTAAILLVLHWLTWVQMLDSEWKQPVSISSASLVSSPVTTARTRRRPQHTINLTADSSSTLSDQRRILPFTSQHQSVATMSYTPNHLVRPASYVPPIAPRDLASGSSSGSERWPAYETQLVRTSPSPDANQQAGSDDDAELGRFAANFRSLVERVQKETETASVLSSAASTAASDPLPCTKRRSFSPPRRSLSPAYSAPAAYPRRSNSIHSAEGDNDFTTGPPEGVDLDSLRLQQRLLIAHRMMVMEQAERFETYEHVIVLGNPVRRMSTIVSLAEGDRESQRWTPTSGSPAFATPTRELTRSPTASTVRTARSARKNGGVSPGPAA